jgi:hypothetical protein
MKNVFFTNEEKDCLISFVENLYDDHNDGIGFVSIELVESLDNKLQNLFRDDTTIIINCND